MKRKILPAALLLSALLAPVLAKSTSSIPTPGNVGTVEPCGNSSVSEPPTCWLCINGDWNLFTLPVGSTCDSNAIRAYNGNAHRDITDLRIAGSVGKKPLVFTRYSNTRLSGRNLAHSAFGAESSWSHNFEWVMRDNGGTTTHPVVKITYPEGNEVRFQRQGASSSIWLALGIQAPDRILPPVTTSFSTPVISPNTTSNAASTP